MDTYSSQRDSVGTTAPACSLRFYTGGADWPFASQRDVTPLLRLGHDGALHTSGVSRVFEPRIPSYTLVASADDADFVVLPMTWNAVLRDRHLVHRARELAEEAAIRGKFILVWAGGDFEAIVPVRNAILIQAGLHRSGVRECFAAIERPAFTDDYVRACYDGRLPTRARCDVPTVGFCGEARIDRLRALVRYGRVASHHVARTLGLAHYRPSMAGTTGLRARALAVLTRSPHVNTNFVIRDRYRAGIAPSDDRIGNFHPTKIEFIANLISSDYVLCVRGGGNFSKRFYEALCCGRVPLLIDTDSVLPFESTVEWKNYCLRVDVGDLESIGERLADFHASIDPTTFVERQHACRELWLERLSTATYWAMLWEELAPYRAASLAGPS